MLTVNAFPDALTVVYDDKDTYIQMLTNPLKYLSSIKVLKEDEIIGMMINENKAVS